MAKTQVIIGYSPNQRRKRTIVLPDDDSQVGTYTSWLKSMGESVLVGTLTDYHAIGPDAMLARLLGAPASDRCAVVNGSQVVVAVICADALMDQHNGGRLIPDPVGVAVVGQRLLNAGAGSLVSLSVV